MKSLISNTFTSTFVLLYACSSSALRAEESAEAAGFTKQPVAQIKEVWREGKDDLYLPFHAYHVRSNYDKEDIAEYRENTWGLGYGRSRYTRDGNWEGVYGMAFLDSNSQVEPIVGYGYQWIKGKPDGLNAGLGYTALVTARARFANYMLPIPAVLPLASISYDKVSLNGTFVPGFQGFGQIFFFWSRVSF